MKLTLTLIAIALPGVALLSSCGGDQVATADIVKSDAPRAAASPPALAGAAAALDQFSADLFAVLTRDTKNTVFSPTAPRLPSR